MPAADTRAVFEMNPDGSGVTKRWFQNYYFDSPSQAPDGSRLLVTRDVRRSGDLQGSVPASTPPSYVTDGCGMSWAPDSGRIVRDERAGLLRHARPADACRTRREASAILTGDIQITSSSSAKRVVADSPADDRDPDWSPDGKWIVFASNRSGTYQIWAVHPDGSGLHQVTSDAWEKSFPAFSPDSGRIVFTRSKDGASDLWSVKVDGTGLKQVTNTSAFETQATYSPTVPASSWPASRAAAIRPGAPCSGCGSDGSDVVQLTKVVGLALGVHRPVLDEPAGALTRGVATGVGVTRSARARSVNVSPRESSAPPPSVARLPGGRLVGVVQPDVEEVLEVHSAELFGEVDELLVVTSP